MLPAAAACLVRFPDGTRHTRRFLLDQPLQLLFDFVDSRGASGLLPGEYSLVTQYPRRVYEPGAAAAAQALGGAGLQGSREVLFLEPRQQPAGAAAAAAGDDTVATEQR